MTTASSTSVSWFNFSEAAIDQIGRAEKTERFRTTKSVAFRGAVTVLYRNAFSHALEWAAVKAIGYIDRKANQLLSSAIWFEGAREVFLDQIASNAMPPDPALFRHIEAFKKTNAELLDQCRLNIEQLREKNAESRFAAAFERLEQAALRIGDALQDIETIAQNSVDSAEQLQLMRDLNASIDSKLARYLDEDELDPELLALADAAIERMKSKTLTH